MTLTTFLNIMMKKNCIFLILTCLLVVNSAVANPVTENQAREIASRFMATKSSTLKLSAGAPTIAATPVTRQAAYYVFNSAVADKGFVIIAADDRLPAVLGYSDIGSFDADDVPPAMQEWLDSYAAQAEAIAAGAAPEVRSASRPAIAPMLPVHWGQGAPYNVLLPHVEGSSNAHAYVGCVATAMAQIMGYWHYPPRPTQTIPGYTSDDGTIQMTMPSLDPMDFDWENMHPAYYVNDSTSDACMAVANLMLYSTTAMRSNFGKSSTSAAFYDIPDRLMTYFGYKNTACYINRANFTTQSWEDTIYAELWSGCPVVYTGYKQSAGHAFVCDGYDGEGRFHINWGWEGKSNGYFLLNLLNPDSEGIGSAAGNYSYVKSQMAVIGLIPANVGVEGTASLSFEQLTINSSTTTRNNNYSNFSVLLSGKFVNNTNVTSRFQPGFGLYNQSGELVKVLCKFDPTKDLRYRGSVGVAKTLNFGENITSGTYRILPIYHIYPDEEDYRPCIGSEASYIVVTINGNSCTIKGYGVIGSTTQYTVNSCTTSGTYNHGKPLTVRLTATNNGTTTNDLIYMFVNGSFTALGLADFAPGKRGSVTYRYTPSSAGTITLSFSLNQTGTPVLYSKDVTINTMPSAQLDVSYRVLNVTDEESRIITADRFSIIADVTNNGTTDYNEDFMARLFRVTNDNTNGGSELLTLLQPLYLPVGETKSLQFDFDHDLVDGWKYYCYLSYYSNGLTKSKRTDCYYINLINDPMVPTPRYSVFTHVEPIVGGDVRILASGHTFADGKIEAGETVVITPEAEIGWLLSGVTVLDSTDNTVEVIESGDGTYTFVMPEGDVNVTVNFVSMPRVTVNAVPSCGGNIQLSGPFVVDDKIMAGETVTISPIPNSGWTCSWVTVVDSIGNHIDVTESEDGTYTFVMPEDDVNVTVNFESMPHAILNVSPSYCGNAQLTGRVYEDDMFKVGEAVTINPMPNIGWQCSGVIVTDSLDNPVEITETESGNCTFVMPRSDVNVFVYYERSTGSLFEFVQGASDITLDETYIVVSRKSDKVMKHWSDSDTTFQSLDIVEWLDEDKNVVRVDDDVFFFTMSQISDTTVSSQPNKAAYMTTGNDYVRVASNKSNVLLHNSIIPQSRVWLRFTKASTTPIHIISFSYCSSAFSLSYDNENDAFKVMSFTMYVNNPRYVYFYKLVESYNLSTDFDSAQGNVAVTGGMVNGTVQRGETVTFTVRPVKGYKMASVQVSTASGEVITTDLDEATGAYSFIMPAANVTIRATFDVSTEPEFILGDVNGDGQVGITDITDLIDYILGAGVDIDHLAADVNQDGTINIIDATELIDMMLLMGH